MSEHRARARGGADQSEQHADRGGLAGPVLTYEPGYGPSRDAEVEPVDCEPLSEALGEAFGDDRTRLLGVGLKSQHDLLGRGCVRAHVTIKPRISSGFVDPWLVAGAGELSRADTPENMESHGSRAEPDHCPEEQLCDSPRGEWHAIRPTGYKTPIEILDALDESRSPALRALSGAHKAGGPRTLGEPHVLGQLYVTRQPTEVREGSPPSKCRKRALRRATTGGDQEGACRYPLWGGSPVGPESDRPGLAL